MSKTFVLIHGTWHGGWTWQEVIRFLSNEGHRACAPTLAGHGPGPHVSALRIETASIQKKVPESLSES